MTDTKKLIEHLEKISSKKVVLEDYVQVPTDYEQRLQAASEIAQSWQNAPLKAQLKRDLFSYIRMIFRQDTQEERAEVLINDVKGLLYKYSHEPKQLISEEEINDILNRIVPYLMEFNYESLRKDFDRQEMLANTLVAIILNEQG